MQLLRFRRSGETVLWEMANGVRCVSNDREAGSRFEITITHGDKVLTRAAFQSREHAAAFALAASEQADDPRGRWR
jgi:hypothetical protein